MRVSTAPDLDFTGSEELGFGLGSEKLKSAASKVSPNPYLTFRDS